MRKFKFQKYCQRWTSAGTSENDFHTRKSQALKLDDDDEDEDHDKDDDNEEEDKEDEDDEDDDDDDDDNDDEDDDDDDDDDDGQVVVELTWYCSTNTWLPRPYRVALFPWPCTL